ncbi:MAG TPA: adenylate/guanylate cyclase domain-containing protein [Aggregatilineales bacterium]|nr:adenylate/guanylate cyclase domain-containing protein [Aggregatilineales bacterium]
MKILVAEDNVDSRELLLEILGSLGYDVVLAFDGVNALEKVDETIPDLCIIDVDMPRKSGFEVVAILKSNPETASIPVIMLTARSDVGSRVQGLGLGADDYLAKPFNPRELIARVNTRLRAKTTADDLRKQRILIEKTFSQFVAQEIIDLMLDNPGEIALGGQLRKVTVLFADLQGFTSVSERENPVQMLNVLNQYHGLMVSIIKTNGGTIDKFLGDGLMALFNAPIDLDDHVFRAVKSALEIRQAIFDFYDSLEEKFRLGINFGIHTGMAVVGNVGAKDLMDYTAVGDTVNLASRLQDISSNNEITISETVHEIIADQIVAERIGSRVLKGRTEPVIIYHVLDFKQ